MPNPFSQSSDHLIMFLLSKQSQHKPTNRKTRTTEPRRHTTLIILLCLIKCPIDFQRRCVLSCFVSSLCSPLSSGMQFPAPSAPFNIICLLSSSLIDWLTPITYVMLRAQEAHSTGAFVFRTEVKITVSEWMDNFSFLGMEQNSSEKGLRFISFYRFINI